MQWLRRPAPFSNWWIDSCTIQCHLISQTASWFFVYFRRLKTSHMKLAELISHSWRIFYVMVIYHSLLIVTHTHTHRPLRAMCFGYSLFLEDINNDFAGGSLSYVLVILMSFTFLRLPRSCPSLCPSLAVVFVRLSVFCSEYVSCCCRRNFLMWSLRASEDCIRCRVCFCVW